MTGRTLVPCYCAMCSGCVIFVNFEQRKLSVTALRAEMFVFLHCCRGNLDLYIVHVLLIIVCYFINFSLAVGDRSITTKHCISQIYYYYYILFLIEALLIVIVCRCKQDHKSKSTHTKFMIVKSLVLIQRHGISCFMCCICMNSV